MDRSGDSARNRHWSGSNITQTTMDPYNPAFPSQDDNTYFHGLTIRAEFAKAAMQAILSVKGECLNPPEWVAEKSVLMADALIAELNEKESV